jgi:hypothetical protein
MKDRNKKMLATFKNSVGVDGCYLYLSGTSKDRRKKYRALIKEYPNCIVQLKGIQIIKTLNGVRVECETTNEARSMIVITKTNGGVI